MEYRYPVLDPYPDGLSNEGTVVVKGNFKLMVQLQPSIPHTSTLNDPIFHIGDTTSTRTVMADASSGATVTTLDSVVGINTGDGILLQRAFHQILQLLHIIQELKLLRLISQFNCWYFYNNTGYYHSRIR